jgi:hypothetical protein
MDREVPQHDRRRLARLAALPMWAAAEFTESEAAVMRIVGVEILNNRGVCALHIKTIAAAAGVSVSTARGALKTAKRSAWPSRQRASDSSPRPPTRRRDAGGCDVRIDPEPEGICCVAS